MSRRSERIVTRARLVLITFVVAIVALTAAIALAQDHGGGPRNVPPGHPPTGGAVAPPGHGDPHGSAPAAPGEHGSETGGDHATAGGHHGPEAINWTNIWDTKRPAIIGLVINFGVLMTIYYMLGKKPIAAALKQRRVTIGKDIEEAQSLLDEAKQRAKKYQAGLKNADVDAATAKAALIAAGKGEVERLLLEAQERADRMKRDAERLVEQEAKQVHQDLLKETVELAVQEASQLLAKSVSADDHARLAQDLLSELASRPGAVKAGTAAGSPPTTGGAT